MLRFIVRTLNSHKLSVTLTILTYSKFTLLQ